MSLESKIEELTGAVNQLIATMSGAKPKSRAPVDSEDEDEEPAPKRSGKGKKPAAAPAAATNKKTEADKLQAHALMKEVAKKHGRAKVVEILKGFKAKVFSDVAEDQYADLVEKAMEALDEEENEEGEEEDDPLGGD